mmetsp:Transcript_7066/g.11736  ORF Transcript_7066/g.11736 Transcript_7066/m.11736 type:complete len:130 (-) Transcript_7066:542-931(-)
MRVINEHLTDIRITGGPEEWGNITEEFLTQADMKCRALGLKNIHGNMTPGHQWNTCSSCLDVAEYAVCCVRDETKIAAGSVTSKHTGEHLKKQGGFHDIFFCESTIPVFEMGLKVTGSQVAASMGTDGY